MDGIDDLLQAIESDSDSGHLLLGGPDLPEKEFQVPDINENIDDLIDGILAEAGAPSITDVDANIINSTSQTIAQTPNVEVLASQDHLSLPKMSDHSEVADKLARTAARKAQREKEQNYQIRKMQKIRKNIDKLKKRAEENIGKKYLGFGETKPPTKPKKKKKSMKTLKKANVSEEEKALIKQLMEYSESSVNSEVSN